MPILPKNRAPQIHWTEVYSQLAKQLAKLRTNGGEESGGWLYGRAMTPEFGYLELNDWLPKFDPEFDVHVLDPMHVFVAMNAGRLGDGKRIARINKTFVLLGLSEPGYKMGDIDFSGCPAPTVTRLMAARPPEFQEWLWQIFEEVYDQGLNGLDVRAFRRINTIWGVGFASFTIFLFWIRPDEFLPIDKNTSQFLVASGLVSGRVVGGLSYIEFMNRLLHQIAEAPSAPAVQTLLVEISHAAFLTVGRKREDVELSDALQELINTRSAEIAGELPVTDRGAQAVAQAVSSANEAFRLLAIELQPECDHRIRKVLKTDKPFYFEDGYTIEADGISIPERPPVRWYDMHADTEQAIRVNICALVGKNGSGKSTLVELLFRMIFNLSQQFGRALQATGEGWTWMEGLLARLYYIDSFGQAWRLTFGEQEVHIMPYVREGKRFMALKSKEAQPTLEQLSAFCYTIGINYSHYALNAKEYQLGAWVEKLFHKNDGYRVPIVINPKRDDGNIDINKENDFAVTRLLANLFELDNPDEEAPPIDPSQTIRQITSTQRALRVEFKLTSGKGAFLRGTTSDKLLRPEQAFGKKNYPRVLDVLWRCFELEPLWKKSEDIAVKAARNYLVYKICRIAHTYDEYKRYRAPRNTVKVDLLEEYLGSFKPPYNKAGLLHEHSHIGYKLKQVVHYLKPGNPIPKEFSFSWDIAEQEHVLERLRQQYSEAYARSLGAALDDDSESVQGEEPERSWQAQTLEVLPPPIFKAKIWLSNPEPNIEASPFDELSSGEKQRIYTVSTILYHLRNLNSIALADERLFYPQANIIMDEVELYFHPDYQREWLEYTLRILGRVELPNIRSVNMCFATHSPYILSDIPHTHVLRLEDGHPVNDDSPTLGANIHELLHTSFFMKNGTMGQYAQDKIQEVIEFLNRQMREADGAGRSTQDDTLKARNEDKGAEEGEAESPLPSYWSPKTVLQFIQSIGEPLVRDSLMALWEEAYMHNEAAIDQELASLDARREQLIARKKNRQTPDS